MRTQRPDDVTLALGASSGDSEIAAETHVFGEGEHIGQKSSKIIQNARGPNRESRTYSERYCSMAERIDGQPGAGAVRLTV